MSKRKIKKLDIRAKKQKLFRFFSNKKKWQFFWNAYHKRKPTSKLGQTYCPNCKEPVVILHMYRDEETRKSKFICIDCIPGYVIPVL